MHVYFTQITERVTAALGDLLLAKADLLLAKAVSSTISVVKCSRQSHYKPCAKGDMYFCGYQHPFLVASFPGSPG